MKTTSVIASLSSLVTFAYAQGQCSVVTGLTTTFYGFPDNSPPGAGTSYSCIGRGTTAGGVGSYADPLTFATAPGEFNKCEVIYAPYLKKYLTFQDECVECESDWKSGKKHIDIWTGSSTENGGQAQIKCEDDLTPASSSIVRNPPNNLEVNTGALFANGVCNKSAASNSGVASCAGGSGPAPAASKPQSSETGTSATGTSANATAAPSGTKFATSVSPPQSTSSATTCEWEGHCAGATCQTYDDCSGAMTCQSGKCAN